ncbi:hypothetical protein GCM10027030_06660 [Luteococcus sediminum]
MSDAPQFMTQRRLSRPEVPLRQRSGRAGGLTVACILDDFSAACFDPEVDLAPLTMRDWQVELAAAQPDMLLVESAWRGAHQTWWNEVFRMGPEIRGILQWCRERGVPTAFWNKEDPVHFRTFLTLAREFDAIFTTDLDVVPRYRAAVGHDNVHFLPFAAQPAVHNPVESFRRIEGCAFAGAYYRRYPERIIDLEHLSAALADSGPFHIYDRNFGQPEGDYSFPEDYRQFIVGGLTPSEIDIAYKGYTANLNLNSVKQSQSMFARRVYELMASNTLVISNFSRGLRAMFGDLALASDSPAQTASRLAWLEAQPNGVQRLRTMALRKVMREHTYAERTDFIARQLGLLPDVDDVPDVFLLATVEDGEQARVVLETVQGQDHARWLLALVGDCDQPEDPRVRVFASVPAALDWAGVEGCTHAAGVNAADWYGPHHLSDLGQALGWAEVDCAGLDEHWEFTDGQLRLQREGHSWQMSSTLVLHRGMITGAAWQAVVEQRSWPDEMAGLAVGSLGHCAGGSAAPATILAALDDLDVDEGASLAELRDHAQDLEVPEDELTDWEFDLVATASSVDPVEGWEFSIHETGQVEIRSWLEAGAHLYGYGQAMPIEGLLDPQEPAVHFRVGPGLDVTLAVLFQDDQGNRLGHVMVNNGRSVPLELPQGATHLRLGFRVKGPGQAVLERLAGTRVPAAPMPVRMAGDTLVISNIYPSHDNLYRNAFVHSRVRAYHSQGLESEVMVVDPHRVGREFREFEDVDVTGCDPATLAATLALGRTRRAMVHVLTPPLWKILRQQTSLEKVVVWVHGFEIQPWWRRAFNLHTEADREEAQLLSAKREKFWKEVFDHPPENFHFVFVSRQFAETVFDDIAPLHEDRYSIIHNPIDTDLFAHHPKSAADARRILSIRPYANATYANDLSVKAVVDLSGREGFDDLHFTFCGDGPLFEETLQPLQEFGNVDIRQGFLTHPEIAELHRDHGIFLVPTRMDTQGVSRDEAMSSGLVPVTTAVAAVPEFVDDSCGVLVPGEDHHALAEGVWQLAHDPEDFLRRSAAAAARARAQVALDKVIAQELALVLD